MVVGEDQRSTGLEATGHARIDCGQPLSEMLQAAFLGDVARQLMRRTCGCAVEPLGLVPNQTAQPDIAKIHQFAVLDVTEIGWVGEHGIKASRCHLDTRSVLAANGDLFAAAVELLANPLAFDRNPDFARALASNLERGTAIPLRLHVLVNDVGPAARPDIGAASVGNTRKLDSHCTNPTGKPCTEKISSDFRAMVS